MAVAERFAPEWADVEIFRVVLPDASPIGHAYGMVGDRQVRVDIEAFEAEVLGKIVAKRPTRWLCRPWDTADDEWRDRAFEALPATQVWEAVHE